MTGEQKENSLLWQQTEKKANLSMYGDFNTIVDVSKTYNIPHDEVFEMSVNAVYTLVDIQRRQDYAQSKVQEMKRLLQ